MRRATPYPCSGPIAANVFKTIKSSVPYGTSEDDGLMYAPLLNVHRSIRLPLLTVNRSASSGRVDTFLLHSHIACATLSLLASQMDIAKPSNVRRKRIRRAAYGLVAI